MVGPSGDSRPEDGLIAYCLQVAEQRLRLNSLPSRPLKLRGLVVFSPRNPVTPIIAVTEDIASRS